MSAVMLCNSSVCFDQWRFTSQFMLRTFLWFYWCHAFQDSVISWINDWVILIWALLLFVLPFVVADRLRMHDCRKTKVKLTSARSVFLFDRNYYVHWYYMSVSVITDLLFPCTVRFNCNDALLNVFVVSVEFCGINEYNMLSCNCGKSTKVCRVVFFVSCWQSSLL